MARTSRTAAVARTHEPARDSSIAIRIGKRLKQARLGAGLTQQQLAGDRYTKAYVSALENALVRPSMAALDYLAGRLGTTASQLIADDQPAWSRLEADLKLAAGHWQDAVDRYRELLEQAPDKGVQAELQRGIAEAFARLDRGADAVKAATRAIELFEALGREADAAVASYWLSAGLSDEDDFADARSILEAVLTKVRAGLQVEPDFKLRLLMDMSSIESREGNNQRALSHLEEVRSLADHLDDRRRATFLMALAVDHRDRGDYPAALRTGYASLAMFTADETARDVARLENELAKSHLAAGDVARAAELAAGARRRFEQLSDEKLLAHVLNTEAQVAAAQGDWATSLQLADDAQGAARRTNNHNAEGDALMSAGSAHAALGSAEEAEAAFQGAATIFRKFKLTGQLRRLLTEWADVRASAGDHEGAFALSREALRSP